MLRISQIWRLAAVSVTAATLCAGLPVQGAAAQTLAQTLAAKCDPTQVSCKASVSTVDVNGNQKNQQVSIAAGDGTTTWQGLNWGIGLAADFDLGGKRVNTVQIDSANIVRVTDTSSNVGVSFVLEAHYFFKEWAPFVGCLGLNCNDVAIGPFVAIEVGGGAAGTPSGNGPITGYALGAMVGLHHPPAALVDSKLANSTWNFGIGLRVDPSAQVLADGVTANRPPPAGITTTDLLTKKEPRYGIMLLSSFSF